MHEVFLFLVTSFTSGLSPFNNASPFVRIIFPGWVSNQAKRSRNSSLPPATPADRKPTVSAARKRKAPARNARAIVDKAVNAHDVEPDTNGSRKRKKVTAKTADSSDLSSLLGGE